MTTPIFSLEGKTAVVIGGTSGIGIQDPGAPLRLPDRAKLAEIHPPPPLPSREGSLWDRPDGLPVR